MKKILHTRQRSSAHSDHHNNDSRRRSPSRGPFLALVLLAASIVLFGGFRQAQQGRDALFIDENGMVRIEKGLVVGGDVNVHGSVNAGDTVSVDGALRAAEVSVDGTLRAARFEGDLPPGAVIAWSPPSEYQDESGIRAPEGWALCDGSNGTPNLVGSFVRGTNQPDSVNTSGGREDHNHGGRTDQGPTNVQVAKGSSYGMSHWNHTHQIHRASHLPPYVRLVYIMKL